MSSIKHFTCNDFRENCYLLMDEEFSGVIVDPGCLPGEETDAICSFIDDHAVKPLAILLTHAHFDHVYGVAELQRRYSIPVYMSAADGGWAHYNSAFPLSFGMPAPDMDFDFTPVKDGQSLDLGPFHFMVIETPGHSAGSVCYYSEDNALLFSGDTLFAGAIGRTDVPEGDYDTEILSIMNKLILLPGSTDVFPGHGHPTTIALERETNPFLEPFNEPEEPLDPDSVTPVTIHR